MIILRVPQSTGNGLDECLTSLTWERSFCSEGVIVPSWDATTSQSFDWQGTCWQWVWSYRTRAGHRSVVLLYGWERMTYVCYWFCSLKQGHPASVIFIMPLAIVQRTIWSHTADSLFKSLMLFPYGAGLRLGDLFCWYCAFRIRCTVARLSVSVLTLTKIST